MSEEKWDLKPLQTELLFILKQVVEVCRKHGIRYYSSGGTMLGAVRHQGFIPWDDDIDIEMPHEDFARFLDHLNELPPHLKLGRGGKDGPVYSAKIYDTREGICQRLSKETNLDIKEQPFIDIFMIEGLPEHSSDIREWYRTRKIWRLVQIYRFPDTCTGHGLNGFVKLVVGRLFGFFLDWKFPKTETNEDMMRQLDIIAAQHPFDESFTVCEPCFLKDRIKRMVPRFFYEPAREVPFEDGTIRIPNRAEDMCQISFGDYMRLPPPEFRIPEHLMHKCGRMFDKTVIVA